MGAFRRAAVVAQDVIDERVLQHAEVAEGVDQAADVVVGVLQDSDVTKTVFAGSRTVTSLCTLLQCWR